MWRSNWTCRRWFLLCKLSGRQLHRATDRDLNDAFIFIDPSVRVQSFLCVFSDSFKFFNALFGARLFVVTSPRHWANDREHDYAKQRKDEHDRQPRGQRSARTCNLTNRFSVCHFSLQFAEIRSAADREQETAKSWAENAEGQHPFSHDVIMFNGDDVLQVASLPQCGDHQNEQRHGTAGCAREDVNTEHG